jgi:hypothetical protein
MMLRVLLKDFHKTFRKIPESPSKGRAKKGTVYWIPTLSRTSQKWAKSIRQNKPNGNSFCYCIVIVKAVFFFFWHYLGLNSGPGAF